MAPEYKDQKDTKKIEPPPVPGKRRPDQEGPRMPFRNLVIWLVVMAAVMVGIQLWVQDQETSDLIPYSPNFVRMVDTKQVTECDIVEEISGRRYITGTLLEVDKVTRKPKKFHVDVVITDDLLRWLLEKEVKFTIKRSNPYLWQILTSVLPVLLVLGLIYFFIVRQLKAAGHGVMGFGKSRARMLNRDKQKVTFKDVAGIEEAKEEVQEIIDFLKDPKKFTKLGGRIPKGVMLMGPPGSGKTLLAKAIAGEADVPFFSISGSDFVEMFVGVGASRVRDMFDQGKKNAPCIIFIDEIDAVGRHRGAGLGGGHDEREQTLNALLVEMDGFDTQEGVIIIAATNRPDVLDPALQRPGRFDRQIVIDLPSLEGREAILKIHARHVPLDAKVDLRRIARGTPGFSGADLANLINEAALLAARVNHEAVIMGDLEEARDKVRWGRERRSRVLDEKEKKITAYHECGHALVMKMADESEPIHKVTIIPRGTAYLGATMQLPEKDVHMHGQRKLKGILASLMGGRVAEKLVFGDITSGASSDLREATRLARHMICDWGMSVDLGPQAFGQHEELLFLGREVTRSQDFSEDTARKIDAEVNALLRECYAMAGTIIESHRADLDKLASVLIERETLDGRDVDELLKFGRIIDDAERATIDAAEAAAAPTPPAPPPPPPPPPPPEGV